MPHQYQAITNAPLEALHLAAQTAIAVTVMLIVGLAALLWTDRKRRKTRQP